MIEVVRQGRFGNNLFQYAFGFTAARLLGTDFFVQDTPLPDYFTLQNCTRPSAEAIAAFLAEHRLHYYEPCENFDQPAILEDLKDNCVYLGHYQSEQYFKRFKADILTLFTPKPHWAEQFQRECGEWFTRPTIAVHIRRGDYLLTHPYCWALPLRFFHDCLAHIENREQYNIIFLSDGMDEVQAEFSHLPNAIFSRQSEFIDFQILMNADIVIGSNSSYSWWGSYLNQKPGRRILAPKHHIGFIWNTDWPPGISVPEWTYIPVPQAV